MSAVPVETRTATAIHDVICTLKNLDVLDEVKTEETDTAARGYRVTILMGGNRNEYRTGRLLRREQDLRLILEVKGTLASTENMQRISQAIDTELNNDPRRNQSAQTTITPGWSVEAQSRDGGRMEQTITLEISER